MHAHGRSMMRRIVGLALALGVASLPSLARADDVTIANGSVTYVSRDVVEVGGHRGLIVPGTSITSDGRTVSIASIVVGMPAELEIGSSGQALELRVKGAVE
jgi:hypothetical protein